MGSIVVAGLLVILLAAMFMTKRRFGVLALALCAGSLLAAYWTSGAVELLHQRGIHLTMPPLDAAVAAGLTVAPALALFVAGPKYTTIIPRIIGSLLFVALTFVLLAEPLQEAIMFDTTSQKVIETAVRYQNIAIAMAIGLAVVDIMTIRSKKRDEHHKKK